MRIRQGFRRGLSGTTSASLNPGGGVVTLCVFEGLQCLRKGPLIHVFLAWTKRNGLRNYTRESSQIFRVPTIHI